LSAASTLPLVSFCCSEVFFSASVELDLSRLILELLLASGCGRSLDGILIEPLGLFASMSWSAEYAL
jgi:hypothetical protein